MTDKEIYELNWTLERQERQIEVLRLERDDARRRFDLAVEQLCGITALLDPPDTTVGGVTYRFKNPMAEEVLRELSARIREVPEKLRAIQEGKVQPSDEWRR